MESNREGSDGIVNAEINEQGELILYYEDGSEQSLGVVVGKDGEKGADGEKGVKIFDFFLHFRLPRDIIVMLKNQSFDGGSHYDKITI